jgi:hypothetical protein
MNYERLSPQDPAISGFLAREKTHYFNHPEWAGILEASYRTRSYYFAALAGKTVVTLLPGIIFNGRLFRIFHSNMPYGGIVGNVAYAPSLLEFAADDLRTQGIDALSFSSLSYHSFGAAGECPGFNKEDGLQHRLDLSAVRQGYFGRLAPAVRRNIRKARGEGVVIESRDDMRSVRSLYRLYLDTMLRNRGFPIWPLRIIEEIRRRLLVSGNASFLFALYRGRLAAGILLVQAGDTVFYLLGGSSAKWHHTRANDLLFHEAIQRAIDAHAVWFDFGASGKKDASLVRYKEKWGAAAYPFAINRRELHRVRSTLNKSLWRMVNTRICAEAICRIKKIGLP